MLAHRVHGIGGSVQHASASRLLVFVEITMTGDGAGLLVGTDHHRPERAVNTH